MRGEQWREVTQRVYPAAIASRRLWLMLLLAVGACLPLLLWGWQRFPIRPTNTAIDSTILPNALRPEQVSPPVSLPTPSPPILLSPAPTPVARTAPPIAVPSPTPPPTAVVPAPHWGRLRVSNRTEHPIRVALLSQRTPADAETVSTKEVPAYDEPVHWDFAPQEGSTRGLILSLPEQELRLQPGDVLVAFAQDGSRRYWGPYVVGETPVPIWQQPEAEWQLVLTP